MTVPTNLDLDVLRTFVTGLDLGSYAKAADRLGRSQSAISLLLRKQGRGLALTQEGEIMLGYARRLLELNDEAVAALKQPSLQGQVRLGLQPDFAETWLPDVLGRFARAHPGVHVEARVDRNTALLDALGRGELDLTLAWHGGEAPASHTEHLAWLR